jgi:hypothetical protein
MIKRTVLEHQHKHVLDIELACAHGSFPSSAA